MRKVRGFPKTLYVVQEKDGDEVYFIAHTDLEMIAEECKVASYTLVSVDDLFITRGLHVGTEVKQK